MTIKKDRKKADKPEAGKPKPVHALSFAGRLRNYFLAGLLVAAPIGITFWLAWQFISFVDNTVRPYIPFKWNPESYLPFALPGIGLLVVLIALTMVGAVTTGYLGRLITRVSESAISQLPIVRSVYSWTRQVFETVLSQKSTAFREVVLVEYPNRGTWAVGFITGRTEGEVQELTSETVVNVFVPATPNPTTGFLLFIPERDVHHLDLTVEEGIKLVISSGIVTPPDNGRVNGEGGAAETSTLAKSLSERDAKAESEVQAAHKLGIIGRLRNHFFTGVLITAPIGITCWLALEIVTFIDDRVTPLIPAQWNPETYLPFGIPGLGVIVVVAVLTLIGFMTAGLVGRSIVRIGERLLDRMPVIRSVYGALKQIFEAVFKQQSNAFRDVVLVQYPRKESWAIGFLTGDANYRLTEAGPDDAVNIFLPTTPNPTSGFLLFVSKKETRKLSMTVEEGIKMVVSGGIVTPPDRRLRSTEPTQITGSGAELASDSDNDPEDPGQPPQGMEKVAKAG
ncbi:DUF502 domain-containing protein [Pelagibius sp. Alg239-R121]|uniref:DUF502 domain-containing protein n=1 Tax=Pelagibius sp. Alg239-R121 TaxID=2993448 RepID=UPI0024A6A5BB|nr:DUF502 domain-containing protein [Pelagibius sp. Alg239-R121]